MRAILVLVLLVSAAPGAAARTIDGEADVAPGVFHEINVVAEVPTRLEWDWDVTPLGAEARFDVHTHDGQGGVTNIRESQGAAGSGTIDVLPGPYSFLWQHPGSGAPQVTVRFAVGGEFRLATEPPGTGRDVAPAATENESPAPTVLAIAAAVALALVWRRRPAGPEA